MTAGTLVQIEARSKPVTDTFGLDKGRLPLREESYFGCGQSGDGVTRARPAAPQTGIMRPTVGLLRLSE
jgi:hypothetical protein